MATKDLCASYATWPYHACALCPRLTLVNAGATPPVLAVRARLRAVKNFALLPLTLDLRYSCVVG
jgi:hypothetical protein